MLTKGAPATWGLRVQIDALRGVELAPVRAEWHCTAMKW